MTEPLENRIADEVVSLMRNQIPVTEQGQYNWRAIWHGTQKIVQAQTGQPQPDADDIAWDGRVKALEDAAQAAAKCVTGREAADKIRCMKGFGVGEQASQPQVQEGYVAAYLPVSDVARLKALPHCIEGPCTIQESPERTYWEVYTPYCMVLAPNEAAADYVAGNLNMLFAALNDPMAFTKSA